MSRRRKKRYKPSSKPPDSLVWEYKAAGVLAGAGVLGLLLLGTRNLHALRAPASWVEALIAFAYALCAFLVGCAILVITGLGSDPPRSFLGVRRNRALMAAGRVLGYAVWGVTITVGVTALMVVWDCFWHPHRWQRHDAWSPYWWYIALALVSIPAIGIIYDASDLRYVRWLRFLSLSRGADRLWEWERLRWRVRDAVFVAWLVLAVSFAVASYFYPGLAGAIFGR